MYDIHELRYFMNDLCRDEELEILESYDPVNMIHHFIIKKKDECEIISLTFKEIIQIPLEFLTAIVNQKIDRILNRLNKNSIHIKNPYFKEGE